MYLIMKKCQKSIKRRKKANSKTKTKRNSKIKNKLLNKKKLRGGETSFITDADQFVVNETYLIEFHDQGGPDIYHGDIVATEFAPRYNGRYTFKGKKILKEDEGYSDREYYEFNDNNRFGILHIFDDEVETCGGYKCVFRTLVDYSMDPIEFESYHTAASYVDAYYVFCTIKVFTDLMNASRVARKNPIKYLPLDVERNIQSFLVENTVLE